MAGRAAGINGILPRSYGDGTSVPPEGCPYVGSIVDSCSIRPEKSVIAGFCDAVRK